MHKWLAIIALLAGLIGGAWSQVPRDGSEQKQHAESSDSKAQPTPKPCTCNVQIQETPAKQTGEPQEKSAKYPWRELCAPANIPNWILALVGVGGIGAALRTLKIIKLQADLMKEQSELMVEKERAKLRIDLKPLNPFPSEDETEGYMVEGSVAIYGYTEAFIETAEIYASIGEEGVLKPLPEWFFPLHLPSVIVTGSKPIDFATLVNTKDGPAWDEQIIPVRTGQEFVFCVAKIVFSDAYGHRWVYRLMKKHSFSWEPQNAAEAEILGKWEDVGLPSERGEYRQEQRPKAT
jgi:hypothetical protein